VQQRHVFGEERVRLGADRWVCRAGRCLTDIHFPNAAGGCVESRWLSVGRYGLRANEPYVHYTFEREDAWFSSSGA
jgi:hypothetical protein